MYSAVFFGLFTASLFLIFINRGTGQKMNETSADKKIVPTLTPRVNIAILVCPNCGSVLEADAYFCTQCGIKVKKD